MGTAETQTAKPARSNGSLAGSLGNGEDASRGGSGHPRAKTANGVSSPAGTRGDRRDAGAGVPTLVTEEATASSFRNGPRPRVGWIAKGAALLARIGADPEDDEELRQKKALLVMLAIL